VRAIALHEPDAHELMGKRVFFEGFKDVEVPARDDDKKYAFVKVEDIRGYEQTEQEN
jgi:hypothetical protein